MANNNTSVVKGVVQPRLYQVYQDLIESKEIMEPISIVAGSGPICGFDWVDTTKGFFNICSAWSNTSGSSDLRKLIQSRSPRVVLSDKVNQAGQVYNAYSTPDGLIHIAPESLEFENTIPDGGWPSLSNPSKAVGYVVKATHTYQESSVENPPSISDFRAYPLTLSSVNVNTLLNFTYSEMQEWLKTNALTFTFDENQDVLIGIYIIGWDPSWNLDDSSNKLKNLIASLNYTLCINPYKGSLPTIPFNQNPLDLMGLKGRVSEIEKEIPTLGNLNRIVNNVGSSRGSSVNVKYEIDNSNNEISFSVLNVKGCNFIPSLDPSRKALPSGWDQHDNYGLALYLSNDIDLDTTSRINIGSYNSWGLTTVKLPNGISEADYWDGSLVFGTVPVNHRVVAVVSLFIPYTFGQPLLPNYGFLINGENKIDTVSRSALTLYEFFNTAIRPNSMGLATEIQDATIGNGFDIKVKAIYSSSPLPTVDSSIQLEVLITLNQNNSGSTKIVRDISSLLINKNGSWEKLINLIVNESWEVTTSKLDISNYLGPEEYYEDENHYLRMRFWAGYDESEGQDKWYIMLDGKNTTSSPIYLRKTLIFPISTFGSSRLLFPDTYRKLIKNPFKSLVIGG